MESWSVSVRPEEETLSVTENSVNAELPALLLMLESEVTLLGIDRPFDESAREKLLRMVRQCRDLATPGHGTFADAASARCVSPKAKKDARQNLSHKSAALTPSRPVAPSPRPVRGPGAQNAVGVSSTAVQQQLDVSPPGIGAASSSPSASQPVTYGYCIASSLYFVLESLMVRCEAQRLTFFVKTPSDALQQVINVGQGMPLVRRVTMASTSGIVQCVFSSGVAANLDNLSLDDAKEFEGPTKPKNALLFPVTALVANDGKGRNSVGVVILINHRNGSVPFTVADEQAVSSTLPIVTYILERYPVDHVAVGFDPMPIHRVKPLPTPCEPILTIPDEITAPYYQKIFRQSGSEKFVRREALETCEDQVEPYDVTTNLVSVDAYIRTLEECWRSGIAEKISLEKMLRVKQNHVNDAKEIFMRKQRRLDLTKEALREQIEKQILEANNKALAMRRVSRKSFAMQH